LATRKLQLEIKRPSNFQDKLHYWSTNFKICPLSHDWATVLALINIWTLAFKAKQRSMLCPDVSWWKSHNFDTFLFHYFHSLFSFDHVLYLRVGFGRACQDRFTLLEIAKRKVQTHKTMNAKMMHDALCKKESCCFFFQRTSKINIIKDLSLLTNQNTTMSFF
jgi:hypothetical protein